MGLDETSFDENMHGKQYEDLTRLTKRGVYTNITNLETADKNASKFFAAMDVYSSSELPVIRERFRNI